MRLKRLVDRYPDFVVKKGMTGTIIEMEPDFIRVKMDERIPGAEPWDNEIHWFYDHLDSFEDDVEVLGEKP